MKLLFRHVLHFLFNSIYWLILNSYNFLLLCSYMYFDFEREVFSRLKECLKYNLLNESGPFQLVFWWWINWTYINNICLFFSSKFFSFFFSNFFLLEYYCVHRPLNVRFIKEKSRIFFFLQIHITFEFFCNNISCLKRNKDETYMRNNDSVIAGLGYSCCFAIDVKTRRWSGAHHPINPSHPSRFSTSWGLGLRGSYHKCGYSLAWILLYELLNCQRQLTFS